MRFNKTKPASVGMIEGSKVPLRPSNEHLKTVQKTCSSQPPMQLADPSQPVAVLATWRPTIITVIESTINGLFNNNMSSKIRGKYTFHTQLLDYVQFKPI